MNASQSDGHVLSVTNVCEIYGVLIGIRSERPATNLAARYYRCPVHLRDVVGKSKHHAVVAIGTATAAFNAACAGQRQIKIKRPSCSVNFPRDRADQGRPLYRSRPGNLVEIPATGGVAANPAAIGLKTKEIYFEQCSAAWAAPARSVPASLIWAWRIPDTISCCKLRL